MFCFVQFFLEAIFSCNLSGFVSYCQSHLVSGVRMARSVLLPEKWKQLWTDFIEEVSVCANHMHEHVLDFTNIFLHSNLGVLELYSLPATFSGLLIFFSYVGVPRGMKSYFRCFPCKKVGKFSCIGLNPDSLVLQPIVRL